MTEQREEIARVQAWVERVVVGWNLCPFARKEVVANRVRYQVSEARSQETLLEELARELELLERDSNWETTLLIHPWVLNDFLDYNEFLDLADGLLEQMQLVGVFQVASFHPNYQFAGTEAEDAENYSNRSPYPLLHLLREKSLGEVIARHPDTEQIPERNIQLLQEMSRQELEKVFAEFQPREPGRDC